MARKPTMLDVAKEAGVALGTVSRVVNGLGVGEPYRQKVLRAMETLGYQYNVSGRTLRTDRTGFIALILPDTLSPYHASLAHHISLALSHRGFRTLLFLTESRAENERAALQTASENRSDGVIALLCQKDPILPEGLPCVTLDRFLSSSVPCVTTDNARGGNLAARQLADLGCRRLACLFTPSSLTPEDDRRRDGFLSACADMKIPCEAAALEEDACLEAFLKKHLRDHRPDFDGIFAGSDFLASRILRCLKSLNVSVPGDVQLIGFGGVAMSHEENSTLSTMVQNVPEIAAACVHTVLSPQMSGFPSLICLPVRYRAGLTTREAFRKTFIPDEQGSTDP